MNKLLNLKSAARLAVCLTVLLVAGCENGRIAFTERDRERINSEVLATAIKRHELFIECMKLSASIERKGDDDVSDIIEECNYVAGSIARHYSDGN